MKSWPTFLRWVDAYQYLRLNQDRITPPACYVHGARVSMIDSELIYSTQEKARKNIAECLHFATEHLDIARNARTVGKQRHHKAKARTFLQIVRNHYQPKLRKLP